MSLRSDLIASVSVAALVMNGTSGPVMAQVLLGGTVDAAKIQRENQNLNAAFLTIKSLNRAHTQLVGMLAKGKLRDDYLDVSNGRAPRMMSIEDHLMRNSGQMRGFTTFDGIEPFNAQLHSSAGYDIRLRACGIGTVNATTGLPELGYKYGVLTILPAPPIGNESMEALVGKVKLGWGDRLSLEAPSADPILGYFNGDYGPNAKFTPINGGDVDLPACLTDLGEWGSDIAKSGPFLALYQEVKPRYLQFRHEFDAAAGEETALCRDYAPSHGLSGQEIGKAILNRGTYRVRIGSDRDPRTETGAVINKAWVSDWTYSKGCFAPRATSGIVHQDCTLAGQPLKGKRTWQVDMLEVPPAKGYYDAGEQPVWAPVEGTYSLFLAVCDDDLAPPPKVIETTSDSWQQQDHIQCSGTYPQGTWSRRRLATDHHYQLENSATAYDIRTYGDWQTVSNGCSRTDVKTTAESRVLGGCLHQSRSVTTTTISYMDGRAPSASSTATTWYADYDLCSSSGLGGSGGNGAQSYDVNGDGVGDYSSYAQARDYTNANGGRINQVDGNCGTCNGPSSSSTTSGTSNQGSSGGGFWSGVGNAISSFFGGGGGSSSGGSSSSRVICTELWRQGLVSRELAVMDLRFTAERLSPAHYRGYHFWAVPMVHRMRRSKVWTQVWKVLAVARMEEIAFQLGKSDQPNYLGKAVRHTLEPISWLIGQFVGESAAKIALLDRTTKNASAPYIG